MRATVLDLRYRMNDVLKALRRNEEVQVYYHGHMEGVIVPVAPQKKMRVKDHPFFGMYKNETESVEETMKKLRKPRYEDI